MGALKVNARMSIYGTEMDVCKTISGVKALKYWKTDPVEIALYERGLPFPTISSDTITCWLSESMCLYEIADQDALLCCLRESSRL